MEVVAVTVVHDALHGQCAATFSKNLENLLPNHNFVHTTSAHPSGHV